MVIAHSATALIAHSKDKNLPIVLIFILGQSLDILWAVLHFLNLTWTLPNSIFDATLSNLETDWTYHHDLAPTLFYSIALVVIGKLVFHKWKSGIILGLLVLGHLVLDSIAGYPHNLYGPHTSEFGTGFYITAPMLAMFIDTFMALFFVWLFVKMEKKQGITVSILKQRYLYGTMILVNLLWFPISLGSVNELSGLNLNLNAGFNTLMFALLIIEVVYIIVFYRILKMD